MSDYIQGSIEISAWLKNQGIEIELDPSDKTEDNYGPRVWRENTRARTSGLVQDYYVGIWFVGGNDEYVCPYFGPGGEGNCLKALRVLEEKNDWLLAVMGYEWWIKGAIRQKTIADATANPDGEALFALLMKLK